MVETKKIFANSVCMPCYLKYKQKTTNHIFVFHKSISEIEPKYYADGEDAYAMRRDLTGLRLEVSSIATLENLKVIPMNVFGSEGECKSLFGA